MPLSTAASSRWGNAAREKTPFRAGFGEGHEFHSCRKLRPLNGGFQPLGECCPRNNSVSRRVLGKGTSSTRAVNAALNGGFQPLGECCPRKDSDSLWFWEGHEFHSCRKCRSQWRLPAAGGMQRCEKTPIRSGLAKGTSSTRAVNSDRSMAASSRWGNAARENTPIRAGFGEGHEFHSCRKLRPLNGGFQPLGECCPRKNSDSLWFWEGHEFHSCRKLRPLNGGFQPLGECCPRKNSVSLWFGEGHEFHSCRKCRSQSRLPAAGGMLPAKRLRFAPGFGKGTSSTRAVTATYQIDFTGIAITSSTSPTSFCTNGSAYVTPPSMP